MSFGILRYCGGKSKSSIINKIKKYFPDKFDYFFEPFCGSASITLSIPPKSVKGRWINDLDSNLISVYLALRDRPGAFIASCKAIQPQQEGEELTSSRPGGAEIYNARLKDKFDELLADPNADPALKYLFINKTNWGGRVNYNEPSQLYFSNPQGWDIVKTKRLEKISERLQGVKITCGDYSVLLEEEIENGLVYCDPPYWKDTELDKVRKLYANGFTEEDHIKLAERLKKCKHKIVLSYDDVPQIRELYKNDFYIYEEEWTYCGTSSSGHANNSKIKKVGKELIITNFEKEIEGMVF